MPKTKITNTPLGTQWYSYTDYEDSKVHTTYFVEAETSHRAAAFLADRGVGSSCRDYCGWDCDEQHFPSVSVVKPEDVPAEGAPKVVDLGGRYAAKDYSRSTKVSALVWVITGPDKPYEAWQTVEYVNEAKYDGTDGYGVCVRVRSVSGPFAVNAQGWDKTGNQSAPAHGKPGGFLTKGSKIAPLGNGFCRAHNKEYWACWFPTLEEAKAFRDSVHKWQTKLPKFNPKEHVS